MFLPNGIYNGVWNENSIFISYNYRTYKLTTEVKSPQSAIEVVVILDDKTMTFKVKNQIPMKIKEIKERVPQPANLPNGIYLGSWGGYVITINYEGKTYEFTTEEGVRGSGFRVMVTIKDGAGTVEEIKN